MARHLQLAALLALFLLARNATAQDVSGPAEISPSSPTNHDLIFARFPVVSGCTTTSDTVVTGSVIRTTMSFRGCAGGPPPITLTEVVVFGPLAPGNYTYQIYFDEDGYPLELRTTQEIVVSQAIATATVPTASEWARIAMTSLLAVLACAALARAQT